MTKNNGTLEDYTCSHALLLPLINEFTWPIEVRAFLYLFGLLYCFMGVAIIADIFMGAIEKITSTTRKVRTAVSLTSCSNSGHFSFSCCERDEWYNNSAPLSLCMRVSLL